MVQHSCNKLNHPEPIPAHFVGQGTLDIIGVGEAVQPLGPHDGCIGCMDCTSCNGIMAAGPARPSKLGAVCEDMALTGEAEDASV